MRTLNMIENKTIRKMLTTVVVVALLIANITVLSHAGNNAFSTNLISAVSAVDSATMLLSVVGVINEEKAQLDDLDRPVTRAELAEILDKTSNYNG